jgi:hypothetical protein
MRGSLQEIGFGVRPEFDDRTNEWAVTRTSFAIVLAELGRWYPKVHVIVEGRTLQKCDVRCRMAIGSDCVCSCAGRFHGMGTTEPGLLVGETTIVLGDSVRREWDEIREA